MLTVTTPNAVLDTNVSLAIYSWHDVLSAAEPVLRRDPKADLTDPTIQFRAQRARIAFLLALFLNERRWMTVGPFHELLRKLEENVPPKAKEAAHKSNFTRFFVHFVKEKLLPDWVTGADLSADEQIKGNDVDKVCLDWAEEYRIPLISWEGDGPNGFDASKLIPSQGALRGIDVVTPESFLKRMNFDERPAIQIFGAAWDQHAPDYVKSNPRAAETLTKIARPFYQRLATNDWTP
jgi:hypothetical protein